MDDLANLMNQLGGATQDAGATDPSTALTGLQHAVQQEGGLDGLMGKLRDAGLGDQVDSWVATGDNQSIDADQLGRALGPDMTKRLSAGSGIDIASLLPLLAAFLPQIIDMLTPDGKEPSGGLTGQGMPDIGDLLGGLAGGGGGTAGAGGQPDLDDLLGGLGGMLGGPKGG
jgi:uncharacterized protein YidB (DUF937 family)